jgi:hypothetical protein
MHGALGDRCCRSWTSSQDPKVIGLKACARVLDVNVQDNRISKEPCGKPQGSFSIKTKARKDYYDLKG